MAKVGLVYDEIFMEHKPRDYHPEYPERLTKIREELKRRKLLQKLSGVPARDATREEIERVHTSAHYDTVQRSKGEWGSFDPDTYHAPQSFEAALKAAGGLCAATEQVLAGKLDSAFCLVRPPGHHAEAGHAMGFCLFNNVAVAAAHALATQGVQRVLIVDPDVHHGNGTQHSFESSRQVFYISTHQYPFYPGTGHFSEVGDGEGKGFTANCPLPGGMGDADYAAVFDEVLVPLAEAFEPQLLLVSAGFDTYQGDPIGGMRVTEAGFAMMAERLLGLNIPTVYTLEGGYDVNGQARCVATVIERMLGRAGEPVPDAPEPEGGEAHPMRGKLIAAVQETLKPSWPKVF